MATERQEVQSPFGERALRFEGVRVNRTPVNPAQFEYQKDKSGDEFIDALTKVTGVAGEAYIEYAEKKANADRVIQTDRAIQGLNPTNDATQAGYKAHSAIKLKNGLLKSKAELKALADSNPSDEEWEDAVREHYAGLHDSAVEDFKAYGGSDPKLLNDVAAMTSLSMSEMMPEVTSYREYKRVEAEEQARKDTAFDTIVTQYKVDSGTPVEKLVQDSQSYLDSLRLTPSDKDAVFANAVVSSRSLKMIEASKNFYNGRKTSLYERLPQLQNLERSLLTEEAAYSAAESGEYKSNVDSKFINGDITEEQYKVLVEGGNTKYPKLFSAEHVASTFNKAAEEKYKRARKEALTQTILKGESMPGGYKDAEINEAMDNLYTTLNESLSARVSEIADPNQKQAAYEDGLRKNIALVADRAIQYNKPYQPFADSMKSLANANVTALESQTEEGKRQIALLGERGTEVRRMLTSMSPTSKELYLNSMTATESKTLRAFDMFTDAGMNPVEALKTAQVSVRNPKVTSSNKEIWESSRKVVNAVQSGITNPNLNNAMEEYFTKEAFNLKSIYPDPNSEFVNDHVKEYFQKSYIDIGDGIRIKGNDQYYSDNIGIHTSHLLNAIRATAVSYRDLIEPQIEPYGYELDDLWPSVDTNTGVLSFNDPDGRVVGIAVPLKDIPNIYAKTKVEVEKKASSHRRAVVKRIREDASYKATLEEQNIYSEMFK